MSADWDLPRRASASQSETVAADARAGNGGRFEWSNGLFDPIVVLGWFFSNLVKIAVIAIIITVLFLTAVMLYPFSYQATAVVLADPREQRITLQEEVLPSIGTDAAVLESMVQIVRSDGFLLPVVRSLGIAGESGATREDELRALARFRRNLSVERRGATYLVEISYRASSGEEAARIANGIADAFADSQNLSRSSATQNAARALSAQLVDVRARLNETEEAVSQFKADNNIVYVDERNTVQMRQLAELNQQLALVRSQTEEARARFDEHQSGGTITRGTATEAENAQISFLRQQRAQIIQSRDQQMEIYGPRHPRLVQTNQALAGIDAQIAQEQRNLGAQFRGELDVALAKQRQIEAQIAGLSTDVTQTDAASVQLEALEREASANRELYQQLLARMKATDQLALLPTENVRIVSEAVPPLNSNRPSLTLLAPVMAFLGFALATAGVVAADSGRLRVATILRRRKEHESVEPKLAEVGPVEVEPVESASIEVTSPQGPDVGDVAEEPFRRQSLVSPSSPRTAPEDAPARPRRNYVFASPQMPTDQPSGNSFLKQASDAKKRIG